MGKGNNAQNTEKIVQIDPKKEIPAGNLQQRRKFVTGIKFFSEIEGTIPPLTDLHSCNIQSPPLYYSPGTFSVYSSDALQLS